MPQLDKKKEQQFSELVEMTIRLGVLIALIGLSLYILLPFAKMIIWGLLLSIMMFPIYEWLTQKLNGRRKLSVIIIGIILLAVILVPSGLFFDSTIKGVKSVANQLIAGELTIPPPDEQVKEFPFGEEIHQTWTEASENLLIIVKKYETQVAHLGKSLFSTVLGAGLGIVQFLISILISLFLLTMHQRGGKVVKNLFLRFIGPTRGEESYKISIETTRNVARGIIGVAIVQATFLGIGFMLAGVPHPGLWALLCLILTTVQIGPMWVTIPVIIYLFATIEPLAATLWTIYIAAGTLIDNVAKPFVFASGARVPMVVIFVGAIGGLLSLGFMGLFIGAIVVSVGYRLFARWNDDLEIKEAQQATEEAS